MAVGASSQLPSDSWDQPHIPSTSSSRHKVATQAGVPDDWDDDDDGDDESVTEESNKRIWEDANAKAPNPMPELIIAPSVTSSNHVVPPPPGAFQPTMRILKRPSSGADGKSATPPPSSAESLKDREARYQAARERIFGPDSGVSTPLEEPTANSTTSSYPIDFKDRREWIKGTSSTAIVRNPRGPSTEGANTKEAPPRGFDGQRKPPFSRSSSQTTTES
ncbi:hypothetical protein C0995_011355 [Termitomyces sp. Mi166|nr:hypothetical protein C0995_011355 [Termitomyces sp. Mi166\